MNHAFVTSSVSRQAGGLFFSVRSLASALDALEPGQVSIHGLEDSNTAEDLAVWSHLRPVIHSVRGPGALGWAPSMSKALVNSDFDLLHTQGIWQWQSAAVHGWHVKTKRPYLISPRGMLDPWAVSRSRWKKRLASIWYESAHLRDAACIHALCQSEADSIRAYGLKNPIAIIPNGVDLVKAETLNRAERDGQELIATCPIGGPPEGGIKTEKLKLEKKILLFLGRIHPKKGLVNALRAWHALSNSTSNIQHSTFHEWQFVVAGWDQGGHRAELEQLCREIGVSVGSVSVEEFLTSQDHLGPQGKLATVIDAPLQPPTANRHPPSVLFLGPAFGNAKDQLLRQAHAFILPSFSEGLPMSVLEAWSYRLPVLMTDHCNLPEGFAADAALRIGTDVESIAEGMRSLLRSPTSDLRSLGLNGRSLVERQFTWPQVAAQMKEVYEWVLGGGAVPGCVR